LQRSDSIIETKDGESPGIFEMISGLNSHRELAGKGGIEQFSTSDGDKDDIPLSDTDEEDSN
jgi:hypothetical protein